MHKIELVVFDLLGTTVEDDGQVVRAFHTALQHNNIKVTAEQINEHRGKSKRDVIRFFVERQFGTIDNQNKDRIGRTYSEFRRLLEQHYVTGGIKPIPKTETTFSWLKKSHVKIAITTGFYRKLTKLIISALAWDKEYLDAIVCDNDVLQGRPAPYMIFRAMEQTGIINVGAVIKVGDTPIDIKAGINAGVRASIGVLSGSSNKEILGKTGASHIIQSIADLPELIRDEFIS